MHGVAINNGNPTAWYDEVPTISPNSWAVAHNTMFDMAVLNWVYDVRPKFITDTMYMMKCTFGTDLESYTLKALGEIVGMEKGEDLILSKGVRTLPPDVKNRIAEYAITDVDICKAGFEYMRSYCPPNELRIMDITTRMFTEPVLRFNVGKLEEYIHSLGQEKIVAAKEARFITQFFESEYVLEPLIPIERDWYTEVSDILRSANKFAVVLTGLMADHLGKEYVPLYQLKPHQIKKLGAEVGLPSKISPRTGNETYAFGKNDTSYKDFYEDAPPLVQQVCDARGTINSNIANNRAKKFLDKADRPWCVALKYAGAHTYRDSGGGASGADDNPQNLPRKSILRQSVEAPPGHVLCVADSGQIEARVNAALALEEAILNIFINNGDIYTDFASKIFNIPVSAISAWQRLVGKICQLALGYQMGALKLYDTFRGWNVPIDRETCYEYVSVYREGYPNIARQWSELHEVPRYIYEGFEWDYGPIQVNKEGIRLPNGLYLRYPRLRRTEDGWVCQRYNQKERRWKYVRLYGGIITENVVQALARIIVFDQACEIDKWLRPQHTKNQIHKIVMRTHDEIVACVPEQKAEETMQLMLHEMHKSPSWLDVPIIADGAFAEYYSK